MIDLKEAWADVKYRWGQYRDWRQARSLDDLALRSAKWARGELGSHPSGYDVPDPETVPLLSMLARVNTAGFFTHQSQPGGRWETNGVVVEQRAYVSGYLARVDMLEFRRHLEGAGMLVLDSLLHDEPLSKEDGVVVTGGRWTTDNCLPYISSAAQHDLDNAANLDVIDTVWCRERALWDALEGWAASHG